MKTAVFVLITLLAAMLVISNLAPQLDIMTQLNTALQGGTNTSLIPQS